MMFFRLMYHVVLPIYIVFIIFSSITLEKSLDDIFLIIIGTLFTTSIYMEKFYPRYITFLSTIQFLLLLLFHFTSQLNWCYSIYIILLSKVLFQIKGVAKGVILSFVFILFYTVIRTSYTPFNSYNILAVGSDFLTSLAVVLIIQYIIEMERKKNLLEEEKNLKELAHKEEKMKLLGEMAAGLAHEIRNPLTIIQGFLQHSKEHNYNIQPWYDLIHREISRMNKLTVEFLQLSKPNVSLYQTHSIHECLTSVISLTESNARGSGHQIIYKEYNPDLLIQMDFDKLTQVFVNLINNAIQAMVKEGTITIRLLKVRNQAVIELIDTGIGIEDKDLQKIFSPFYTTKSDGTGLGLSICQKIIQDHGGTIEVNSTVKQGASFTISFPLR